MPEGFHNYTSTFFVDSGKSIYIEHEKMHRDRIERDSAIFSKLSDQEKDNLINTMNKVYEQLAVELKKQGMDEYI